VRLFFSMAWFILCVSIAFGCIATSVIIGQIETNTLLKLFLMFASLFGAYIWINLTKFCRDIM